MPRTSNSQLFAARQWNRYLVFSRPCGAIGKAVLSARTRPLGLHSGPVGLRTSDFFGRETEAAHALSLLEKGARLLTLTGPSGIGKTRLAFELLERLGGRKREIFVCDLSACTEEDEIVPTLARALGVSDLPKEADPLRAVLAERGETLVIIDNAEQVASALAERLLGWIEGCPATHWLVTSQWRLDLADEHVLELHPLTKDDAMALWEARVRQVRPDYNLEGERAQVERLLEALDAIPLAIELAAARHRVMTARQMHERLAEGLSLLSSTRKGRPDRHKTLERAIEWSFRLLDPHEQSLLAQCTVFETDFTLAAIEAVGRLGDDAPPILDVIQSLRDKSMLQMREVALRGRAEAAPRFALYASVRSFAAARLADRDDVVRRHATHTTENAEALCERIGRSCDEPPASRELERELSNLRAAIGRALTERSVEASLGARALIAFFHGLLNSGAALDPVTPLVRAFLSKHRAELPRSLQAELAEVGGRTASLRGDLVDSYDALTEAAATADGLPIQPRILAHLAYTRMARGETDLTALLERGLSLARVQGDLLSEALLLKARGDHAALSGELSDARAAYERAIEQLRAAGYEGRSASIVCNLAYVHLQEGRTSVARELFIRGRELHERLGSAYGVAYPKLMLCYVRQDEGGLPEAVALYEAAITDLGRLGERRLQSYARAQLGIVLGTLGDLARASQELARGAEGLRAAGDLRYAALYEAARRAVSQEGPSADASEPSIDDPLHDARRVYEAWCEGVEEARASIASARVRELASRWYEVRQAVRLIEALALGAVKRQLVLGPELAWLEDPTGARHDLAERPLMQRLVRFLLERRQSEPGRGASAHEMIAAGWPGERIVRSAGLNRLYVAVRELRKLGLADVLIGGRRGYYLDPAVHVRHAAQ